MGTYSLRLFLLLRMRVLYGVSCEHVGKRVPLNLLITQIYTEYLYTILSSTASCYVARFLVMQSNQT